MTLEYCPFCTLMVEPVVQKEDETFYSRKGCPYCNTWWQPVRLRNKREKTPSEAQLDCPKCGNLSDEYQCVEIARLQGLLEAEGRALQYSRGWCFSAIRKANKLEDELVESKVQLSKSLSVDFVRRALTARRTAWSLYDNRDNGAKSAACDALEEAAEMLGIDLDADILCANCNEFAVDPVTLKCRHCGVTGDVDPDDQESS